MKMSDKTKQKMTKQRLKRIKAYYKSYERGYSVFHKNRVKYLVLGKHELYDEYYFIVQDLFGRLLLQKLVYNGSVNMVGVSKEGRQYAKNKDIFDSWFKEVENYCNKWVRRYYNDIVIGARLKEANYILVLKKEYNDNYYFVLRDHDRKYLVAKLVWSWYIDIRVNVISTKEFDADKSVFYAWINEAKSQGK